MIRIVGIEEVVRVKKFKVNWSIKRRHTHRPLWLQYTQELDAMNTLSHAEAGLLCKTQYETIHPSSQGMPDAI